MVVYVEVALMQNALIDGMLLTLSLLATRQSVRVWRIVLSSALGAVFAVVFPLFSLPAWASVTLKIAVGFLLVWTAFPSKGWGRYAITALCFFLFSFALAGAIIGLHAAFFKQNGDGYSSYRAPVGAVAAACVLFFVAAWALFKRLYKRGRVLSFVYPCRVKMGKNEIKTQGFLDSGNLARKNGRPVCFLSPELVFSLIDETAVREFIDVDTVAGSRRIPLFKADEIQIYFERGAHIIKNVYVSPSTPLSGGDYGLIMGACVLEGESV